MRYSDEFDSYVNLKPVHVIPSTFTPGASIKVIVDCLIEWLAIIAGGIILRTILMYCFPYQLIFSEGALVRGRGGFYVYLSGEC